MKAEQIRAIAQETIEEMWPGHGTLILKDEHLVDFATRFLAALNAKADPVALYPCGFKKLHSLVIEMGAFLAQGLTEDEPVTEAIRSAAMVLVGYAKDMSSLLAKHPLYTHPPFEQERCAAHPEPAPQTTDESTSGEHCASGSAKSVGAAPLPDDVAKMVEQLRESHCHETADMLERLARQVPPDCVVVPKWLFEQLKHYSISHLLCYPNCGAPSEKEIEEAMIAAGQINLNQGETK